MTLTSAQKLAEELMQEHGLLGWTFEFDRAVKRFGLTSYNRMTISLSKHLTELNDEIHVKNTILHEIAHALVGKGVGHKYAWKRQARAIGCDGQRNYSKVVQTPTMNYISTPCGCGTQFKRVKRTRSDAEYRCNRCLQQVTFSRV